MMHLDMDPEIPSYLLPDGLFHLRAAISCNRNRQAFLLPECHCPIWVWLMLFFSFLKHFETLVFQFHL